MTDESVLSTASAPCNDLFHQTGFCWKTLKSVPYVGFLFRYYSGPYRLQLRGPLSKLVVAEYRTHLATLALAPSTINVRLSAIRKLATRAAEAGLLSAERAAGIQNC